MEKILIIGCRKIMDEICFACNRCFTAFNQNQGEFVRYTEHEAEVIGLTACTDCPGKTLVPRLALLWNSPLGEEPTKIHLAPCVVKCPHGRSIAEEVKSRCGIEIIEGTHPYQHLGAIFGRP
jgi:predicted metal-binding protein